MTTDETEGTVKEKKRVRGDRQKPVPGGERKAGALTQNERRIVWIAAATGLLILLALFFIGMFTEIRATNPFLDGFYWIANVIAATSAGALAATISGFLKVVLERKFGQHGRILIQAGGGFAVFVLVLMANPKNRMFELADELFASLLFECQQAVEIGNTLHPNGRELCQRFTEIYPFRPEPWRYLARWVHINEQEKGFKKASELYQRAVALYGLAVDPVTETSAEGVDLTPVDRARVSETVSGFMVTRADYALSAFARREIDEHQLKRELDQSLAASRMITDCLLTSESDPFIWGRALDVRGKIYLYRYEILDRRIDLLFDAEHAYDQAIDKNPTFKLLLMYHRFVVYLLQASEIPDRNQKASAEVREMLALWDDYVGNPNSQWEIGAFKRFLKDVMENRREEPYRVSRPFGSHQFGGAEIESFLRREPDLARMIQERIDSL